MTDHSPIIKLPQSSYTIKEAAILIGKSDITLVRWCRDGVFPQSGKVPGPKGDEWSIQADDLAAVIAEKNLTIDLAQAESTDDRSSARSNEEIIGLREDNAELREKTGHLTGQNEQLATQVRKLGDDLDHARAEWQRAGTDRDHALGEAEALRGQLEIAQTDAKKAEKAAAEASQERDSLDQKYRELEKSSGDSLSTISDQLDTARSEAEQLVGERDELASEATSLKDAMGWWSRRKYERER